MRRVAGKTIKGRGGESKVTQLYTPLLQTKSLITHAPHSGLDQPIG